jgi:hypothetical protein
MPTQLPPFYEDCSNIITLLTKFITGNEGNDTTWDKFETFMAVLEQSSVKYGVEDEYLELVMIRNKVYRLREDALYNLVGGRGELFHDDLDRMREQYHRSIKIIKQIKKNISKKS